MYCYYPIVGCTACHRYVKVLLHIFFRDSCLSVEGVATMTRPCEPHLEHACSSARVPSHLAASVSSIRTCGRSRCSLHVQNAACLPPYMGYFCCAELAFTCSLQVLPEWRHVFLLANMQNNQLNKMRFSFSSLITPIGNMMNHVRLSKSSRSLDFLSKRKKPEAMPLAVRLHPFIV